MKRLFLIPILLSAIGLVFAEDTMERKFEIGSGNTIEIDLNTGGSIDVQGWDQKLVHVIITADFDLEDYDIEIRERSGGISVDVSHHRSGGHSGDINVTVKVPQESDLELETMGGEITIDNITGKIEGETMGGEIDLSNLRGKVEMTTMGGEITVSDSDLKGEVKTMGGEITFRNVSGDVKGSTMGGDVKYIGQGPGGKGSTTEEVRISTMGGDIKVDDAPLGANVSTMGGDVTIGDAGKFVKASTMGGDVEIKKVDGGIKASTMGGDVTATMVGDPNKGDRDIDISSMGGDITVTVPPGLSMDFNIKLTYTKNSSGSPKINCDFPINIKESDEWDYSEGSPRKYIYGTGEVNGGKFKVKIETINGVINIRKGS